MSRHFTYRDNPGLTPAMREWAQRKPEPNDLYQPVERPDEVQVRLWQLKQGLEACRFSRDAGVFLVFAALCGGLFGVLVGAVLWSALFAGASVAISVAVAVFGVICLDRQGRVLAAIMDKLAAVDDVRALPLLMRAFAWKGNLAPKGSVATMWRLLRQVEAEHRPLFDQDRRTQLVFWAKGGGALALPALAALRHVGTVDAIPHLRPLAAGRGIARGREDVQQMASEVLTALEGRIRTQAQPRELLRGAAGPEQPASALLRPAQGYGATPPDELPRASVRPAE